MQDLKKAVFVSGASSGLGRAVAEHLSSRGYTVYAGARSFDREDVSPPAGCVGVKLDVTDTASVSAAFRYMLEKEKEIYALVNCAAFFTMGSCEEVPPEELARIMNTNFIGMVRNVQAVLPVMRKQGYGRIINFSSINGVLAVPFQGAYTASKHAIEGWSEALAQEISRFGIDVSVVEPGDCKGGSQKYRHRCSASADIASPYYEYYKAGTDKIHSDEENGMDQLRVASAVCGLLDSKKPPYRKVVATLTQRSSIWLHKFLARRTFNGIITDYYAPKK